MLIFQVPNYHHLNTFHHICNSQQTYYVEVYLFTCLPWILHVLVGATNLFGFSLPGIQVCLHFQNSCAYNAS